MTKKERPGWEWNESGKYWVRKTDPSLRHSHTVPIFCPHCQKICGTIDDDILKEYGFCKECYVMHVEERKTPTIDLDKYRPLKPVKSEKI